MAELSDEVTAPSAEPAAPTGESQAPVPAPKRRGRPPKRPMAKDVRRTVNGKKTRGGTHGRPREISHVQRELLRKALNDCWTYTRIYRHFANEWQIDESTVRRSLDEIQKEISDALNAIPIEVRAAETRDRILDFIDRCYEAHINGNDKALSPVPQALRELARIDGAHQPKQVQHDVNGSLGITTGQMSDEQVQARIAELMKKHGPKILGGK